MRDRNVQYPNRFHVRPVAGTDDIFEIVPAPGTVYEEGTFFNKANMLQDLTAALYGKGPDATPDEIFAVIQPMVQAAYEKNKIVTGAYVGTGSSITLTFGFRPKFFCCTGYVVGFSGSLYGAMAVGVGDLIVGGFNTGVSSYTITDIGTISDTGVIITQRLTYSEKTYKYIAIG